MSTEQKTPNAMREPLSVLEVRILRGPHLYSATPMVRIQLDLGCFESQPTSSLPGFTEKLLSAAPGLARHGCSQRKPGGFVERLQDGTWLGHVIEHVALELQTEVGMSVTRGKTRSVRGRTGVYNVMFAYRDEELARAAGRLAIELVLSLIDGAPRALGLDRIAPRLTQVAGMAPARAAFKRLADTRRLGPSTQAIVDAAERRGIPVTRLDDRSFIRLGWGSAQRRLRASISSATSHIAVETAGDKDLTKQLLLNASLPAPRGGVVRTPDEALRLARTIGFPVVVKPLDANHGRGVSTNVRARGMTEAFARAKAHARRVIVEQQFEGRDYRALVIGGKLVAVADRVPAFVQGDGVHTIAELVDLKNQDPRRAAGHANVLTNIELDDGTQAVLARTGLHLNAVPAPGQRVPLKQTANLSTGGEAIDRTDEIHAENKAVVERAASIIGLDIAGIDLVCPDITRSMRETGGGVIEVNAAPGLRMHLAPSSGRARAVGEAIVDALVPRGQARIPVLAVTGTNGKSTTARMVAHILRQTGVRVGLSSTSGAYIDDQCIWAGDASGPKTARMLLSDPTVDVAVLETARGGIVREGLGFDRCDVGAVLNISADHLGVGGVETLKDLAAVKSVVVEAVRRRGVSVLNFDDAHTRAMARHAGGRIAYFSMRPGAMADPILSQHIEAGAMAALLETEPSGEVIALYEHGERYRIMSAAALPCAFRGAARFNLANALAAAAICKGAGVELEAIQRGLKSFNSSFEQNPGRMNVFDTHGVRVILDYAHNPGALAALGEFVAASSDQYERVLATVSTPGDRRDEDIRAMGEIAGRTFDFVVFRERPDARGRAEGDVMRLLTEGARRAGMCESDFLCIAGEAEATAACLSRARARDLVVLMPTDVDAAWAQIKAFKPNSSVTPRDRAAVVSGQPMTSEL
ncbi:cyanophycin synthetase [Terricaulis sp.]|uniref:cyanophycin synthetase n=1 Tax=Terricaulis sp. TaxID=2768686 RepID=UPI002AC4D093|nr:cyanophycin synthetase [Terricaulis sp.]MDZ4690294.1 cyanophycin synthetase [Terricaulis sp.]